MRELRPLALAALVTILSPCADLAAGERQEPERERICGWIDAEEILTTPDLRRLVGGESTAGTEAPSASGEDCRAVWRCLLAARGSAGAPRQEAMAPTGRHETGGSSAAAAACREILALSQGDVEELRREALGRLEQGAGSEADTVPSCASFVECVLRRRLPAARDGATQEASEVPSSELWKKEFARICSHTEVAVSLPPQELEVLIAESATLLKTLAELKDPQAKVYASRLEKCKALFEFALELQQPRDDRPQK